MMKNTTNTFLSLYEHYGTMQKVADHLGTSRQRVQQILAKGAKEKEIIYPPKKLRKQIKEEKIYQRYLNFSKELGY